MIRIEVRDCIFQVLNFKHARAIFIMFLIKMISNHCNKIRDGLFCSFIVNCEKVYVYDSNEFRIVMFKHLSSLVSKSTFAKLQIILTNRSKTARIIASNISNMFCFSRFLDVLILDRNNF